ncbi:MAG TPA: Fe-S cluster domain-containing protein [Bacteroidales bacterium]|nr:Fe-S cluster domain-containing protein [Bacteroidales bacterium]HOR60033.1 Fe-S cluster domain-containing protein [Bacteroidales bacterium]HPL04385.1 Fe-S cluster domain-containing protein [Bacteroidales bacterium]HPX77048.1 Fe-S cluster domain-containing protein [Bacteroidales bacterium]HQB21638.1 Fe-S cluster domain-containing protein [Bacteroidales bacterium]
MEIVINTLITLSLLGAILAVILYLVAQKFKVVEDPRIDTIQELLPGANCGGCGYPGCRGFAETIVKTGSLENMNCPAGGSASMKKIAEAMGLSVEEKEPQIAVVRCNGSLENRKKTKIFDGPTSCAIEHSLFSGDTDCAFGCLGLGDCVVACPFDAIHIDEKRGLPIVDEEKCVACGLCVKSCPKNIIELRNKGKKDRRIYVSCINKDRGADAKRACDVACIGCGKCAKECKFEAISIENFVAYIDFSKCKLCRKCASVCPTGAILEINFPPKKEILEESETLVN